MPFPINRLRRLRRSETLRRMVRETILTPDDFIQPYFVCPGRDVTKPVAAMPGVAQMSVDQVLRAARETDSQRRFGPNDVALQLLDRLQRAFCLSQNDVRHCGISLWGAFDKL